MTRALILAAGQGTRLRPLTNDRPKCLVPLLGKSLLEHQVATLRYCKVDDIHIATGYRADQIESLGFETSFNPNFDSTNMVESLFCATPFIEKDLTQDLVISYGDIVYQPSRLQRLLTANSEIALLSDTNWRALWSLRLENPLEDAETFRVDKDGRVLELGKIPNDYSEIQGQYTGLIKIRSDVIAKVANFYKSLDREATYDGKDFQNMYMTSFLQQVIERDFDVRAIPVASGWLEVDSVEDLECYESMASRGTLSPFWDPEEAA